MVHTGRPYLAYTRRPRVAYTGRLCVAHYNPVNHMRHAGRTERQEQIAGMADALRAEGWKPLCNGGFFYNYAAAWDEYRVNIG